MKKILCTLAVFSLMIIACSKDSEETLPDPPDPNPPGGNTCVTENMSYMNDIVPILQANCYSCHGTNTSSGSNGNILEGYNNLKTRVDNGKLMGSINHSAGFVPMPYQGIKLPDCTIDKIQAWIDDGALEN